MPDNHLFDAIRSALPGLEAIFIETHDGRVLTYGDMLSMSAHLAHVLATRGVKPGDRVAAQVEKSAEALMLYLACVRCGAVYLPLNTGYTLAELDYFFNDAKPALIVVSPHNAQKLADTVRGCGAVLETLDEAGGGSLMGAAQGAPAQFSDVRRGSGDLAAILYTSGTTGRSKGAMLSHDNLLSNALTLRESWRFTAGDRLIHALPVFHTHGLFVATNTILVSGASMFLLPKFDPDAIVERLPRSTVLMGVPTFYVRLAQDARVNRDSTAGMRLFISGSAPLLAETHETFRARTGHAILERYGMTETNMNTSNPYDGERIAGTVGFPLPGVDIRVVDIDSGAVLHAGETGMLEVRGPNVFQGYWNMPDKTKAEFRDDGFFITGDLGLIDERGYVHIVGRGKDLVISGGYNIYPREIESEIDRLDGVLESAVIGVPHGDLGEGVTAVVVPRSGAALREDEIVAALGDRLARYKLPRRIVIVDELPRNTMGKVQKNLLRDTYKDLYTP
ncbi:malonate--CoA ligase [Aquamicrobium defluvii]|uniref:3-methylmercaptopropionyl-CoA ligase n=1 Tax=Aquamicrobium defluvii TaxID=69279 RepID=A0A011UBX6_9HYPH|nr:malonyl-CoA synthase [Aquamicrobium defluvii]EXL03413.1 AMP-binding protein [Aquamicrobium defluvii]EZQ14714.1 AMP-binding protein [Halopseudomonas bauzanensis]TDR34018.1 malonyl-CoA/methylmalonyl-CoA synthetase [Aquamicrobium defluvii]